MHGSLTLKHAFSAHKSMAAKGFQVAHKASARASTLISSCFAFLSSPPASATSSHFLQDALLSVDARLLSEPLALTGKLTHSYLTFLGTHHHPSDHKKLFRTYFLGESCPDHLDEIAQSWCLPKMSRYNFPSPKSRGKCFRLKAAH